MSGEAKEIKIPVPWGHISGKWWGPSDLSPIICLHGWQDNAGSFDTLIPLLPSHLAFLALDSPGHGFSSPLHPGQFYYHWWDGLLFLRRIVFHFDLEKVSLIGHSRGGSIVFLYAAAFPDEVEKAICIDSAYPKLKTPEKIVEETRDEINKFLEYDGRLDTKVRCFNKEVMVDVAEAAYKGSITRESCEVLMRRGMSSLSDNVDSYYFTRDPKIKLSGLGMLSKDLVIAYAKKITCAYLNIQAESDTASSSAYPELYDEVLDIIKKNSKRFEYHNCTGKHHLHLNDPKSIAGIIGEFLTS